MIISSTNAKFDLDVEIETTFHDENLDGGKLFADFTESSGMSSLSNGGQIHSSSYQSGSVETPGAVFNYGHFLSWKLGKHLQQYPMGFAMELLRTQPTIAPIFFFFPADPNCKRNLEFHV